ncbi:MAG: shikimate kinase, partial [Acidobacteriota bacterium]
RYEFLDMDAVIEIEAGVSIPVIFETQGEAVFRSMEADLVRRLAGRTGCVVATGGGTIANPDNLEILKSCGTVVCLTADPQTILARVGSGEDRPMLDVEDKEKRITELMGKRAAAYAQADITVDTSTRSIDEVAHFIHESLQHD